MMGLSFVAIHFLRLRHTPRSIAGRRRHVSQRGSNHRNLRCASSDWWFGLDGPWFGSTADGGSLRPLRLWVKRTSILYFYRTLCCCAAPIMTHRKSIRERELKKIDDTPCAEHYICWRFCAVVVFFALWFCRGLSSCIVLCTPLRTKLNGN